MYGQAALQGGFVLHTETNSAKNIFCVAESLTE
jgi:hypothetical protein